MRNCDAEFRRGSTAEPSEAGGQPAVKGKPQAEEHTMAAAPEDSQEDEDGQEDAEEKQAKGLADLMDTGALDSPPTANHLQH